MDLDGLSPLRDETLLLSTHQTFFFYTFLFRIDLSNGSTFTRVNLLSHTQAPSEHVRFPAWVAMAIHPGKKWAAFWHWKSTVDPYISSQSHKFSFVGQASFLFFFFDVVISEMLFCFSCLMSLYVAHQCHSTFLSKAKSFSSSATGFVSHCVQISWGQYYILSMYASLSGERWW